MPYGPHADPKLFHVFSRDYDAEVALKLVLRYDRNQTGYEIWSASAGTLLESYVMPHRDCVVFDGGYWLYPYFGGQDVAPQTMTIELNETQA